MNRNTSFQKGYYGIILPLQSLSNRPLVTQKRTWTCLIQPNNSVTCYSRAQVVHIDWCYILEQDMAYNLYQDSFLSQYHHYNTGNFPRRTNHPKNAVSHNAKTLKLNFLYYTRQNFQLLDSASYFDIFWFFITSCKRFIRGCISQLWVW